MKQRSSLVNPVTVGYYYYQRRQITAKEISKV